MNSQNIKACIMDQAAVDRAITRIAHEIIEKNKGVADLAIVGIQRRGVPIARDIADRIKKIKEETLCHSEFSISRCTETIFPLWRICPS